MTKSLMKIQPSDQITIDRLKVELACFFLKNTSTLYIYKKDEIILKNLCKKT